MVGTVFVDLYSNRDKNPVASLVVTSTLRII